MTFDAVIFDWRGTLVTTLSPANWIRTALGTLSRPSTDGDIQAILSAVNEAGGDDRLDAPGVDTDAELHRHVYMKVFADAGLDAALAEALYAIESDASYNPFAVDVMTTLTTLRDRGLRVAVLSDIHFDLRPAFDDAGLAGIVDVFTLSFEQGIQKPHPEMFTRTLSALNISADRTLMVGDRSHPDGPAVEQGITTLLLPPLSAVTDQRLHHVVTLCGQQSG